MAPKIARISLASFLRRVADILTPIRDIDTGSLGIEGEIEHNENLPIELSNYAIEGTWGSFHNYLEDVRSALNKLKEDHLKIKPFLKDSTILDQIEKTTLDFVTAADAIAEEGELDDALVQKIHHLRNSLDTEMSKIMGEVLPQLPDSYNIPELEGYKHFPVPPKVRRRWFMRKKKAYCITDNLRLAAAQIASSVYIPHEWPQVGESFTTWINSIKRVLVSPTLLGKAPPKLIDMMEVSLKEYIDLFKKKQELDVTTEDLKQLQKVLDSAQHEGSDSRNLASKAGKLIPKIVKRINDFVEELRVKK